MVAVVVSVASSLAIVSWNPQIAVRWPIGDMAAGVSMPFLEIAADLKDFAEPRTFF